MFSNPAVWIHGLVSAFITGAVGAFGGVVIAPETFNLQEGLTKLWQLAAWAGISGAFTYLKTSPLPAIKQAIEDKKAELGAIILACGLLFSTGCVGPRNGGVSDSPMAQVDNYIPVIEASAMIGTRKVLKKHPDWKDEFELAAADLEILATAEDLDFLTIMSIVQRLPVKQLQGEDAQLYIEGATVLLAGYGDRLVALDKLENVSLVAGALAKGIRAGSR